MEKKQRVVLVTGGIQGIGKAIVDYYVCHGDQVFIFDIKDEKDDSVTALLSDNVAYKKVDISNVDSIKQGFSWIDDILQDRQQTLDILVNNAGITHDRLSLRITEDDWDNLFNVNLKGAFFCTQQALRRMIKSKEASARYVVMISSVVAHTGNVGQSHYAASKAGLIALTKSLAREYAGRNILINAVAPGYVDTLMTKNFSDDTISHLKKIIPLGRSATTKEIACTVAFLTSGNADYITGQVININGGMVML